MTTDHRTCAARSTSEAGLSVIVAVGPDQRHLSRMLRSLDQHADDVDAILVCDGVALEREHAEALEQRPRTTVLESPGDGAYAARNAGVRAARTSHVTFLDSDDEYRPRHAHHDACLTYGDQELVVDPTVEVLPSFARLVERGITRGPHLMSMVVRRQCLLDAGGFHPHLRHAADLQLQTSMTADGHAIRHEPTTWLIRHLHDANESNDVRESSRELFSVLRKRIDRSRTPGSP